MFFWCFIEINAILLWVKAQVPVRWRFFGWMNKDSVSVVDTVAQCRLLTLTRNCNQCYARKRLRLHGRLRLLCKYVWHTYRYSSGLFSIPSDEFTTTSRTVDPQCSAGLCCPRAQGAGQSQHSFTWKQTRNIFFDSSNFSIPPNNNTNETWDTKSTTIPFNAGFRYSHGGLYRFFNENWCLESPSIFSK